MNDFDQRLVWRVIDFSLRGLLSDLLVRSEGQEAFRVFDIYSAGL